MREVKVAQLAGSVAELSSYHHGEVTSGLVSTAQANRVNESVQGHISRIDPSSAASVYIWLKPRHPW